MFCDDIEQLVSQTFKEAEFYSPEQGREFFFEEEAQNSCQTEISNKKLPNDAPGVLYYLQKSSSTFVLRMLAVQDLAQEWKRVTEAPENYPSLRLLCDEDDRVVEEKLEFFECDNVQLAKELKHQLANKRFPLHEERVINISDPGDNWWIKPGQGELTIYFKLCRTECIEELVKAGPLGDIQSTLVTLNKLYGYFSLLFPIKNFSSAHGQFALGCEDSKDPLFAELIDIFLRGEFGNRLWERLRQLEAQARDPKYLDSLRRANYFLMSIATARGFWMKIQEQLD